MGKKTIRVFGTYYTETDKGRGYAEEYNFTTEIETELTGGELKSFVQKKFIEKFLTAKLGRDKFRGWQTCDVEELPATASASATTPRKKNVAASDLGIE